jgi:hypothetical protein
MRMILYIHTYIGLHRLLAETLERVLPKVRHAEMNNDEKVLYDDLIPGTLIQYRVTRFIYGKEV